MHSQPVLILASGSEIRKQLLLNAGLSIDVFKPMIDEEALKMAVRLNRKYEKKLIEERKTVDERGRAAVGKCRG